MVERGVRPRTPRLHSDTCKILIHSPYYPSCVSFSLKTTTPSRGMSSMPSRSTGKISRSYPGTHRRGQATTRWPFLVTPAKERLTSRSTPYVTPDKGRADASPAEPGPSRHLQPPNYLIHWINSTASSSAPVRPTHTERDLSALCDKPPRSNSRPWASASATRQSVSRLGHVLSALILFTASDPK